MTKIKLPSTVSAYALTRDEMLAFQEMMPILVNHKNNIYKNAMAIGRNTKDIRLLKKSFAAVAFVMALNSLIDLICDKEAKERNKQLESRIQVLEEMIAKEGNT